MNQSLDIPTALGQGLDLHRRGQIQEAEQLYLQVLARQPDHADAANLLAVLLTHSGRAGAAIAYLQRGIALAPERAEFHANLARAHHALGHASDALPCMRKASELAPDSAEHLCALGALLQEEGQLAEAASNYQAALLRQPGHVTSRYNLATVLYQQSRTPQAVDILQTLLLEQPELSSFRTTLAGYLLELDRTQDALQHCNAALASNPRNLMAMTLKSVALLRLGHGEEARWLLGLERLVKVGRIPPVSGFENLTSFNAALREHILTHPTLVRDRPQNATRNGQHTDNLLSDADPGPMAALAAIFDRAVAGYLNDLPVDAQHPFLAWKPARWQLQSWAVVMHAQGQQLAHTHPAGWVSGVYYAATPAVIREEDDAHAGWIEFGRPLPELLKEDVAITRILRPEEGMLVLFPSYLYHQTVAFDSPTPRISIAFDAVPG